MKKILMLVALVLGVSAMAEDATNTASRRKIRKC